MTAPSVAPATLATARWLAVCRLDDLVPERGAAALVGDEQVALFRLVDDRVLAVAQLDPFSGAHVISRGIVGSRGAVPTVASPMYKQVFDLRTGQCVEPLGREPLDLRTWPVRVEGEVVMIGVGPALEADLDDDLDDLDALDLDAADRDSAADRAGPAGDRAAP
ncbi:nitrite reductase small subunit NirD [Pengzhenrongella frigida]|uniref:Nitrite reductase small subunit NirD n=1 Tax=Pengzhenrongella frigida TaxID=1259133 RepID=A0A4Q5MVV4_9MICO|nr:nitrite reductase small subunit NirD [Cellulomonas sp. HLT2-17]